MESSDEPAATASSTQAAPAIRIAGASPPTLPPTDDALPASSAPPADPAPAENPRGAYLDSCRELQSAIGGLEAALVAFTGKEEGIKGQVFAKTRARLERELGVAQPQA
mgnify:CR=1 FL=1